MFVQPIHSLWSRTVFDSCHHWISPSKVGGFKWPLIDFHTRQPVTEIRSLDSFLTFSFYLWVASIISLVFKLTFSNISFVTVVSSRLLQIKCLWSFNIFLITFLPTFSRTLFFCILFLFGVITLHTLMQIYGSD